MNAPETDVKLTLFSEYRNSSFQLVEVRLTKEKHLPAWPLDQPALLSDCLGKTRSFFGDP